MPLNYVSFRGKGYSPFPSPTTTEQAFVSDYLSRLPLDPEPKVAFVPGPTASRAGGGDRGLWTRLEAPTGTKGPLLS